MTDSQTKVQEDFPISMNLEVKGKEIEITVDDIKPHEDDETMISIFFRHSTEFSDEEIGEALAECVVKALEDFINDMEVPQ